MSYQIIPSTARDEDRCKTWSCCGLDEPLANYSADHEIGPSWYFTVLPPYTPEPGITDEWRALDCLDHWCYSNVSQAAADACADAALKYCQNGPDPNLWYYNNPQTCTLTCDDGGIVTSSVAGGIFLERTQEEADAKAISRCQAEVARDNICILGSLANGCYMGAYSDTLDIAGTATPASAFISEGALPAGILMQLVESTLVFSGTSQQWGSFRFTVAVIAEGGMIATKSLGICILRIVTPDDPEDLTPTPPTTKAYVANATLNEAYAVQFEAEACSGNYSWDVVSGTLPNGMILDSSGALHGTPTVAGDYEFIVEVTDDETGNYTVIPTPTRPPAGLIAAFIPLPTPGYIPGTFQFVNKTIGKGNLVYSWDFGDGGTSNERDPVHTYTTDYARRTVTLTAYDGYISSSYILQVGLCQDLIIEGFDIAEWALAHTPSSYRIGKVINEDEALAAEGCIERSLPPKLTGTLRNLSTAVNLTDTDRMAWPLYPENLYGTVEGFHRGFRYLALGANDVEATISYWKLNTCLPFPTYSQETGVAYYSYVALVIKKAPAFYPNGYVFQAYLNNGPSPASVPFIQAGNWEDWIPRYTALKPFVGAAEDNLPTGVYTWTDDPDMYYPAAYGYTQADVIAWRAADNTPLTVTIGIPP